METLVSAARESTKQVTHFLTTEPPTYFDRMVSSNKETADPFSVKTTRIENVSQIAYHSRENGTEPGRATSIISRHIESPAMKSNRPVFNPMSSDWFHLGSWDAPLVRQAEPVVRPAGNYIGPFNDEIFPAGNTTNKSEDHNWRQRKENVNCTEEIGHILKHKANTSHI